MNWSVIAAVNNEEVLRSCLLDSPDIQSATEVILQRGYSSAASAYNEAIAKSKTDLLVLVHQDVYFPAGWIARVQEIVERLAQTDPHWAVLGVWGVTKSGVGVGHVYDGGTMKQLGGLFDPPVEVQSLDEVVLILRKSSGLRFDNQLAGFHLYATDLCLEAARRSMKCYAISALCIHNTNGYNLLPFQFWQGYFFMRRKWQAALPVTTSCTKITTWCGPMIWWNIDRMINLALGRHTPGKRVPHPAQLLATGGATSPNIGAEAARNV